MKLSDVVAPQLAHDPEAVDILRDLVERRAAQFDAETRTKGLAVGATGRLMDDIRKIIHPFVPNSTVAEYLAFMVGAAVVHEVGVHRVTSMFNHIAPDANVGQRRRRQVRGFSDKGAAARRRYTEEQRQTWRALYASEYTNHSMRNAARLIAKRLGLPPNAAETVRKAISPGNG